MQWKLFIHAAFCWLSLGPASSTALFADLAEGRWTYAQNGGAYELLPSVFWQDQPINPMQFPTFHAQKEVSYSSPFFPSWSITTVTSTTFAGRNYPQISSQIESNWVNVQDPRADALVGAEMHYDFQAWKKYDWVPDLDVPLRTFMSIEVSATRFAEAYASAGITYHDSNGTHDIEIDLFTWRDGNSTKSLERRFVVQLDSINKSFLNTSVQVVGQDANGSGLSGNKQASAIADPILQIDPDAFVIIDGTSYRATELYGLSFSPGFSAVPEPDSLVLGFCMAVILGLRSRMRPIHSGRHTQHIQMA